MLLLGVITIFWPRPPSKVVAHAIQHLAAGILLSAIALELIPTIAAAKQKMSILGMVVGFSLGSIVMITLPMLLDEEEEEEHGTELGEIHASEGTNLMSEPSAVGHNISGSGSIEGPAATASVVTIETNSHRPSTDVPVSQSASDPPEALTFLQVIDGSARAAHTHTRNCARTVPRRHARPAFPTLSAYSAVLAPC